MSYDEAVWKRNRVRDDILTPCKLCRNESVKVCNGYCSGCYKEILTGVILADKN